MNRSVVCLALSAALSFGLGLLHPFGNPRVEPATGFDTLLVHASIPAKAKQVLVAKCANCHSQQTHWPFYAHLAPGSWLIERDIVEARRKMNLSSWDRMSPDDQRQTIRQILHEAGNAQMPPAQYRLLHWKSEITPDDMTALSSMQTPAPAPAEALTPGDPARGKMVFQKRCMGCHALQGNREGPPLASVFGRRAGSVAGYRYSPGLRNSGITWNEATLEKWLSDPDTLVPDNKMDFHLPKAQERADILAWFEQK